MKKTILLLSLVLTSKFAFAATETSSELSCRAKAKEVAAESYRICVTEAKNSEIEKLRKDYQDRLKALKNQYEKEIEKLGNKTKKSATNSSGSKRSKTMMDDGSIEVHAANPVPAMSDDSQMDLPEPIPVESTN